MRIERLARAHSLLGWLTFLAFLGSGAYLRQPEIHAAAGVTRALYRANHLYLLGAALLNLLAARAAHVPEATARLRARLRELGSLVLLALPLVLGAAFLREPRAGLDARPLTMLGEVMALVGTALIALTTPKARDRA